MAETVSWDLAGLVWKMEGKTAKLTMTKMRLALLLNYFMYHKSFCVIVHCLVGTSPTTYTLKPRIFLYAVLSLFYSFSF